MTSAPKYTLRWSAQAERNVDEVAARIVPELKRPNLRETFLGRHRDVYRVDGRDVTLVTVFAGERDGWPDEIDPDAD